MEEDFYTGPEIAEMLGSPPTLTDLSDGSVRIGKAGVFATGPNYAEAAAEWGRSFSKMVVFPKIRRTPRSVAIAR